MSESLITGMILAAVGGFLDAYTYLCRGGVFANAQTGNIVLLGIKASQGDIRGALRYAVPIVSFMLGIVLAQAVRGKFKGSGRIHWRQVVLAFETAILAVVSFLPQSTFGNMLANVLVSFVCSLQVQSFRKINGKVIATTMCTGNLRSATEHLCNYAAGKDKAQLRHALEYGGIIVLFIAGAVLGALAAGALGAVSALAACAGLAAAFILMLRAQ